MNQKIHNQLFWVMGISLTLIACGQADTGKGEAQTADTTSMQTEMAQPPAEAKAPDAVTAAPNLYRVLSDSLGIRIVEVNYQPGDSSAMHTHPDNALYMVKGGTATFITKEGTSPAIEFKTGMTAVRPTETHSSKNTGQAPFRAILVEVNRPMVAASRDETMDPVKVAPNQYKLKSDSAGIRVIEISYKPGQSSAMHAHPDGALYVIEGGTSEFTEQDGSKQTMTLKSGTAMIAPAGVHSVKNVGTTTTKAILVEVYRQRQ